MKIILFLLIICFFYKTQAQVTLKSLITEGTSVASLQNNSSNSFLGGIPNPSTTFSGNLSYINVATPKEKWLRPDNSIWAEQSTSAEADGFTSLTLHTNSTLFPNNINGSFEIHQGNGNSFILSTDSVFGGWIGWKDPSHAPLTIGATEVYMTGMLQINSLIKTGDKLIVSDEKLSLLQFPKSIKGYFFSSDSEGCTLTIESNNNNSNANATLFLKQNGVANYISTTSSNSTGFLTANSLIIQSVGSNNIILNASKYNFGSPGSIIFGINSNEVARIDGTQTFLIGTTVPDECSIFTMVSNSKGYLPPRMHSSEKEKILSPTEGLTVYDLDLHKLCFFNGRKWEVLTSR